MLTIAGHAFEVRTASGAVLKGTLTVDASTQPSQVDMVHADGARWEAIYALEGDTFRLNYVEAGGKDLRPTSFMTSGATEATMIVMRRESTSLHAFCNSCIGGRGGSKRRAKGKGEDQGLRTQDQGQETRTKN